MERCEHELRRALRWYPRHYRERYGEEIIGTALDLHDSDEPAACRAERWGLVRAGLLTRLRERPPLLRRLAYRLLGMRMPHRYRMWVRDDLLGRWSRVRHTAEVAVFWFVFLAASEHLIGQAGPGGILTAPMEFGVGWGGPHLFTVPAGAYFASVAALAAAGAWLDFPRRRRRTLRMYDFRPDGTPMVRQVSPRVRGRPEVNGG